MSLKNKGASTFKEFVAVTGNGRRFMSLKNFVRGIADPSNADPQCGKELEEEALETTFWNEWKDDPKGLVAAVKEAKGASTFKEFVAVTEKEWKFWLRDRWDDHNNRGPGI